MMNSLFPAVLLLVVFYAYQKLYHKRFKQNAHIPQVPKSLLFGHLKTFDEFLRRGKEDRHPDYIFSEMRASIGNPPLMLVDLWPVNRGIVFVSDHEIAEQITKSSDQHPVSPPRSPLRYLEPVIGSTSILSAYGEDWKNLRKRFNPGFSPQHVKTLYPFILDKTPAYIQRLDELAQTGAEFSLVQLTISLIFDIIGAVVIDTDLGAQHVDKSRQSELIRLYSEMLVTYTADNVSLPSWMFPRQTLKRYRLGTRIDELTQDLVRQKHAEQKQRDKPSQASRSILSLSLQDIETLTPEMVKTISDQIKTFLFAGYDTTSVTLAWAFYELSRTPRALLALRSELDAVLGPESDPTEVSKRLLAQDGPDLVRRLSYVSAIIKETLRLHPPAGTGRVNEPNADITVRTKDGESYCLNGLILYVCSTSVHQDKSIYGESAADFVPERWLREEELPNKNENSQSTVPPGAWRPFERGPRNCIGQDFAMNEMRIIITLLARRYDFIKVGLGEVRLDDNGQPVLQDNGQYAVTAPLYNTRQITAKPVDEMMVKVRLVK